MLGVMFAIHSDEKGLILPPKMAINNIVIVPIIFEKTKDKVLGEADKIAKELEEYGAFVDCRDNYQVGFKFNEWELKGIPLRIEIGPRDLERGEVIVVRRDNFEKKSVKLSELKRYVASSLEDIQKKLFEKSKKTFNAKIVEGKSLEDLKKIVEDKKVALVPLCKDEKCEEMIKSETKGAKVLWIEDKKEVKKEKCIVCDKKADYFAYSGKSY